MISKRPEDYAIEIGPMGPIGEGEALLLRINRNCPWNQCLFCPVYKGKRFAIREVDEVNPDPALKRGALGGPCIYSIHPVINHGPFREAG